MALILGLISGISDRRVYSVKTLNCSRTSEMLVFSCIIYIRFGLESAGYSRFLSVIGGGFEETYIRSEVYDRIIARLYGELISR